MQAAAAKPPTLLQETGGGPKRDLRLFKKVRMMKRSFVETTAATPSFGDERMAEGIEDEWFKDDIVIESDDETSVVDGYEDIPVVQIPKDLRKELVEP